MHGFSAVNGEGLVRRCVSDACPGSLRRIGGYATSVDTYRTRVGVTYRTRVGV